MDGILAQFGMPPSVAVQFQDGSRRNVSRPFLRQHPHARHNNYTSSKAFSDSRQQSQRRPLPKEWAASRKNMTSAQQHQFKERLGSHDQTLRHERPRREYRGNVRDILVDTSHVDRWKRNFMTALTLPQCAHCLGVFEKYEARVNRFGYSLTQLDRVDITTALQPIYAVRLTGERT